MRFTSGVTGDNKYIISMEAYNENDIPFAWEMTKLYHKLDENASIIFSIYDEKWLTVKWEGNVFYQTFHETQVADSILVRVFNIENNSKNIFN
jgi:hypothetical protein